MKLLAIFALALASYGQAVAISDTLTNAVGAGGVTGRIAVTLSAPGSAQPLYYSTSSLTGWQAVYCLGVTGGDCTSATAAGVFAATLYANSTITPAGTSYAVRFAPTRGSAWTETWVVTPSTTTLRQIRATTVPTPTTTFQPSQLSAGGAANGNCLVFDGSTWAGAACASGGSGTVTSVSVATANGVSGTVATATTTPAISLSLGAVSPTSITVSGTGGAGFVEHSTQTSAPSDPVAGRVRTWAETADGYTRLTLHDEGTFSPVLPQDSITIVRNTSGSSIPAGSVVRVTGNTGDKPNVSLAQANSSSTLPARYVTAEAIGNNAYGQVMRSGIITGTAAVNFNTSAFTAGDQVYVSTTVAGGLTNTRPSGTTNSVQAVGTILRSHPTLGSIDVQVAPAVLNIETGTNAATWTGSAVVANTLTGQVIAATGTPASASAAGIAGTIVWDASYIYVCVATNTWKRVAIASW